MNLSQDPFRVWERESRAWWAWYERKHPAPRRSGRPGRWAMPAYLGPGSPQSPVWVEHEPRGQGTLW